MEHPAGAIIAKPDDLSLFAWFLNRIRHILIPRGWPCLYVFRRSEHPFPRAMSSRGAQFRVECVPRCRGKNRDTPRYPSAGRAFD